MATIYDTAFQESLANIRDGKAQAETGLPSYMVAADTMNVANRNLGFLESAIAAVDYVPKFIGLSVISGINQLYNIPANVGNLVGGDFEINTSADVIASLDSDLGQFYEENQSGIDLVGFMLSSLVPGTAGVKVLNAGQRSLVAAAATGKVGSNMGKAMGLSWIPKGKQAHLDTAIKELISSNAPPTIFNRQAGIAVAQGMGQNVLEGVAFEVAVAATMHSSPIFEGHDLGDYLSNIAWGAGLFGIIGGAVDAAKISSALKKASNAADLEAKPWNTIFKPSSSTPTDQKIASYYEQLRDMPPVPDNLEPARKAFLESNAKDKVASLENEIRSHLLELAKGDGDASVTLYNALKGGTKLDQQGASIGLKSVSKMNEATAIEKQVAAAEKRLAKGNAKTWEEDRDLLLNTKTAWAKAWGEDLGKVTTDVPTPTQLVDTLVGKQKLQVDTKGVRIPGTSVRYSFNLDYLFKHEARNRRWDIMQASPMESNARYIWASELPKIKPTAAKPVRVHENDIPLMEKLLLESTPYERQFITIEEAEGTLLSGMKVLDVDSYLSSVKNNVAVRLHNATSEGLIGSDAVAVANKLRYMLGIKFKLSESLGPGVIAEAEVSSVAGKISLSEQAATELPLHRLVTSILHEEGHIKFDTYLQLGGVPKELEAAVRKEVIALSRLNRPEAWEAATEGTRYYEYLNDMHELMADSFAYATQFPAEARRLAPTFHELYGNVVRPIPQELVDSYVKRSKQLTQDEIAAMVNVKSSYLSGEQTISATGASRSDILALQDHTAKYNKMLLDQGSRSASSAEVKLWEVPQHIKLTYNTKGFERMDGFVEENMVRIKELQKEYVRGTNTAAGAVLGQEVMDQLPDITSDFVVSSANRTGAGGSFLAAASSANYGSLGSVVEYIGNTTSRTIQKFKESAREVLDPALYKLANNEAAAIEYSVLEANIRGTGEVYGIGTVANTMEPLKLIRWKQAAMDAQAQGKAIPQKPLLVEGTPEVFRVQHKETMDAIAAHIEVNGKRTKGFSIIRSAQGSSFKRDPEAFYPIPIDPKDYPNFAIVKDDSITGGGHSTMLYATNSNDLQKQIDIVSSNPQFTVLTKKQAEDYYKSIGQWDAEKTLDQNYMDAMKKRVGISQPFAPKTNPEDIAADILNWHMQRETGLVREAVTARYEVQFAELKSLGDSFTGAATSKFSKHSLLKYAEEVVKNPYGDYIKTALAVRKNSDYPIWEMPNRMADKAVSIMYNRIAGAVESGNTPEDLLRVNAIMEKAGYKGAHYSEDMDIFANARADKGILTRTIQMANSVLATVILRLDALNAINNAVSANVLLGAETRAVIKAIERGDADAVGALADIMKSKVPGTDKLMITPGKLIAKAMAKWEHGTPAELQQYTDRGVITTIHRQYKDSLENLTYTGGDIMEYQAKVLGEQGKLARLADTGEKWTGNRLAEEFNRFVAADVMKQMTDIAVSRGLMDERTAWAYINTFVNRTQGNYLAAQRPGLFQGPIGQAIGLFQTYQFNLLQQLLRHVGDGHAKDAMTLLALQGTIHGMNGLPAFNAINTYVVGTASGNTEHTDAFNAIYGIAGKDAGDWLLYGVASNMLGLLDPDLKINLYTRGDINPRHVTIVPTSPAEVPVVQAFGKFFNNIFTTADRIAAGGEVSTTLLQGLEHNSISRPLAGLAITLQGIANEENMSFSTTRRGNIIASNDLLSIANLGRLLGGKPLDEAIAQDATYRYKAYALQESGKRATLGDAIKTTMIGGQTPTQEQIESFAESYAASGGRASEFNSWFTQLYKDANLSQANQIARSLNSPFSKSMQQIMGGAELRDFE
jgi:hypothetical protein